LGAGVLGVGGVALIIVLAVVVIASLVLYFLPVAVALFRHHPDTLAITGVCVLFVWTFLGWGLAMIWALKTTPRQAPQVVIHQGGGYGGQVATDANPFANLQ
jgi:Superinfection immunity protein